MFRAARVTTQGTSPDFSLGVRGVTPTRARVPRLTYVSRMTGGPEQLERVLENGVSLSLSAVPGAAGQARRALAGASEVLLKRLGRDGLLLLTELINNAVLHGSRGPVAEVSVDVRESSKSVRVEVRDDGAGFTWRHPSGGPERAAGYGLVLVDAVADRWGIDTSTERTCVWFEL